jgi:hypothetical protein
MYGVRRRALDGWMWSGLGYLVGMRAGAVVGGAVHGSVHTYLPRYGSV